MCLPRCIYNMRYILDACPACLVERGPDQTHFPENYLPGILCTSSAIGSPSSSRLARAASEGTVDPRQSGHLPPVPLPWYIAPERLRARLYALVAEFVLARHVFRGLLESYGSTMSELRIQNSLAFGCILTKHWDTARNKRHRSTPRIQ